MDFRTEIKPVEGFKGMIAHDTGVVLIGSCFTDNIGACMRDELFEVCVNPFGPIYNPASIDSALAAVTERRHVEADELFEHEGRWHSFLFHSRYSAPSKAEAMLGMNSSVEAAYEAMCKAGVLIITLGTTRIFRHAVTRDVVANCHKLPGATFEEQVLTLDECACHLEHVIDNARSVNPGLRIVFTVSPMRYLANGAHANSISKSTLLLAIDRVQATRGEVYYFPAYEIMMDDLRDYRFYAEDMRHPSAQAVKYIYGLFAATFYSQPTCVLAEEARRVTRRLAHRRHTNGPVDDAVTNLINDFKKAYPLLASTIDSYISDGLQHFGIGLDNRG